MRTSKRSRPEKQLIEKTFGISVDEEGTSTVAVDGLVREYIDDGQGGVVEVTSYVAPEPDLHEERKEHWWWRRSK